jgi:hypothetical protein
MKKIIVREEDFKFLQDSIDKPIVDEPIEDIPPSELGMEVINNLIHAIDRFYTVRGLRGGIPGVNARLYEKYNLDGLKKDLMRIRNSQ